MFHDGHLNPLLLEQYCVVGLPQTDAVAVAEHLKNCADCRCMKEALEFWAEIARGQNEAK